MPVEIISVGEALVEMVKCEHNSPHHELGTYQGSLPSGAPAIFASAAGRLARAHGMTAGFIGAVGQDAFGDVFIDKLQRDGLDTRLVQRREGVATGIAFVQLDTDGSRSFVFSEGAAAALKPEDLPAEYFASVRAVHISGSSLALSKQLRDVCYHALNLARQANPQVLVTFDPNFRVEMAEPERALQFARPVLEHTTHLLPSGPELEFLTGQRDLAAASRAAFAEAQRLRAIVLKQGERGCRIFSGSGSKALQLTGLPAVERYPTGAGDNFGGSFLAALLAGQSLEDAARFSCAAGAIAVEQPGLMKEFRWEDVQARLQRGRLGGQGGEGGETVS